MRFPKSFTRTVSGGVPWTTDVLPQDANNNYLPPGTATANTANSAKNDNFIGIPNRDQAGYPISAVAVAFVEPSGGPASLTATLYVWDTGLSQYLALNPGGTALKPGITLIPAAPLVSSPASAAGNPAGQGAQQAVQTAADYVLIVSSTGATTNGTYTFALGGVS